MEATRLPTICCVDFVTFLTVEGVAACVRGSGGGTDRTVSGELVGAGLASALSPETDRSPAPTAVRNQPLTRDCTGDDSGVGESEGKDVRLLSSGWGEGVRPREALELRLSGRTRVVWLLLPLERVELWDEERTRSTVEGVSEAAIFIWVACGRAHSTARPKLCIWHSRVMEDESGGRGGGGCRERYIAEHVGRRASLEVRI